MMSGTNATTAAPAPLLRPRENSSNFAFNSGSKALHFRKERQNLQLPTRHCIAPRSTFGVGCWMFFCGVVPPLSLLEVSAWFATTRLTHPFHHRFRAAVADDFHALAFVNQLSLRNHIEDFIAELGLAPGPQLRNGDPHSLEARHLLSLEPRSRDDSTGRL